VVLVDPADYEALISIRRQVGAAARILSGCAWTSTRCGSSSSQCGPMWTEPPRRRTATRATAMASARSPAAGCWISSGRSGSRSDATDHALAGRAVPSWGLGRHARQGRTTSRLRADRAHRLEHVGPCIRRGNVQLAAAASRTGRPARGHRDQQSGWALPGGLSCCADVAPGSRSASAAEAWIDGSTMALSRPESPLYPRPSQKLHAQVVPMSPRT
jgi:hypothetical protein